jgi:catechol-2,3-dioxygenase
VSGRFDGICELVLETPDVPRLARFYASLGLELLSEEHDRVWLAAGERARLGIWSPGEKEHDDRGGAHVHFALAVPRGTLVRLAEGLRRAGLDVKGPIEHEGGDRSLYVFDPEGNRVELWDYFHEGDGARQGVGGLSGD